MSFYQHAPDLVDDIHRGRTRSISPTYSETESVKSLYPVRHAPRVRFDLTPPPSQRRRVSPSPERHRHRSSRSHPRSFTPPPFTSTEDQTPSRHSYHNGYHHHHGRHDNQQYHNHHHEGHNDHNEHREIVLSRPAAQQMMNASELEPLDDRRMVLRNQHANSFNHNDHDEWALANTPGMEVNMECRRGHERNCAMTVGHPWCGFPQADYMWRRGGCGGQHSIHCHRRYGRCGCPCACNVNVNVFNGGGNQINNGAPPAYPGIQQPPVFLCGGACGRGPHQILPGTGGTSMFYAGSCPIIITNCGDSKKQKSQQKSTEIICLGDVLTTETKGRIKVRVPRRKSEANVNCSVM